MGTCTRSRGSQQQKAGAGPHGTGVASSAAQQSPTGHSGAAAAARGGTFPLLQAVHGVVASTLGHPVWCAGSGVVLLHVSAWTSLLQDND